MNVEIFIYATSTQKKPFLEWLHGQEFDIQGIIQTRLDRVRIGNLGDCKPIKGYKGLWELRVSYGPGYRVYFGKIDSVSIVLLVGGDKSSQSRDIRRANKYWAEFKESYYE